MHIVVIGAGVVGLSCAVRLAEAGHAVEVVAAARATGTTSSVAAAIWYPYRAAPAAAVLRWTTATYAELVRLAARPGAGVALVPGRELLRTAAPVPAWAAAVPDLAAVEQPPPGFAAGWSFTAPVADMPVYLAGLEARLLAAGGRLRVEHLTSLPDEPVLVDAAGLGARELAPDPSLSAVRGQVVLVEQPAVRRWSLDQSDPGRPVYVVPRTSCVVVGGTADDGAEDLTPSSRTAEAVLERATAVEPLLAGARVLGHRVGLRPVRPAVRLEVEPTRSGRVVHCYGHGGAGVTLSWGCADDVLAALS